MNPQKRKYYAIIVHYGAQTETTKRSARSLLQAESSPDEIIIINNSRTPLDLDVDHPHIVITPDRNTGYAGGINLGLGALINRGAKEDDIVIVMNNDVTLEPNSLAALRHYWSTHRQAQMIGPITQEHGSIISTPSHVNLITGRTHPGSQPHRYTLPYLHGAFLAAPYRVYLDIKGLPEQYFMYWEDPSLARRLKRHNIPFKINKQIKVKHQSGSPNSVPETKLYYLVRNGALFLERETPLPWRLYWYLLNRTRLIYHSLSNHLIIKEALADAVRGKTGARPERNSSSTP